MNTDQIRKDVAAWRWEVESPADKEKLDLIIQLCNEIDRLKKICKS